MTIAEKAFDKTQHPLIINTPRKLGIEGNFLNGISAYKTPIANILRGKNFKAFPLNQKQHREPALITLFHITLKHFPGKQDKKKRERL